MMDDKNQRLIKRKISSPAGLLSDSLIQQFLQTQHQKAVNEAETIKLKVKELDHNKDLSLKYMEIEADLEKERPRESRKTYTRIAYIGGAIIAIFLLFTGFCLYIGKEQFLIELIRAALYPILTIAGYYAGIKRKPKKVKKEELAPAELVTD